MDGAGISGGRREDAERLVEGDIIRRVGSYSRRRFAFAFGSAATTMMMRLRGVLVASERGRGVGGARVARERRALAVGSRGLGVGRVVPRGGGGGGEGHAGDREDGDGGDRREDAGAGSRRATREERVRLVVEPRRRGGSVGVAVRGEPRGFQDGFELPARRAASRRGPPARAIPAVAANVPTTGLHVRLGRPLEHPLVALRPGGGRVVGLRVARVVAPTTARRPTLESATHRRHRRRRRAARNASPAGVSSRPMRRPTRGMFTRAGSMRDERNFRDIFAPRASRFEMEPNPVESRAFRP